MPRPKSNLTPEEKKLKQKEYHVRYYQKNKEGWNDYSLKPCECGLMTSDLWKHKKTKLHKDVMSIRENQQNKTD